MTRSRKIAGTLAAALMLSTPLAFASTASFAAAMQHNDRDGGKKFDGKQTAMRGHDGGRYDRDGRHGRDGRQFRHHRYSDRMHRPAQRFERAAYEIHPGFAFFAGRWVWQVNHWHWIAGTWQHR